VDRALLFHLSKCEVADQRARKDPSYPDHAREVLNLMHTELFAEAVKRGLRDPYTQEHPE